MGHGRVSKHELCIFLVLLGVSLLAASMATNHWLEIKTSGVEIDAGLFEYCDDNDDCLTYDDTSLVKLSDDMKTIQALVITGMVLYILALILHFPSIFCREGLPVASVLCFLAAGFIFGGFGHFARMVEEDEYFIEIQGVGKFLGTASTSDEIGYSAYLASASGSIAVLTGIITLVVAWSFKKKDSQPPPRKAPPPAPRKQSAGLRSDDLREMNYPYDDNILGPNNPSLFYNYVTMDYDVAPRRSVSPGPTSKPFSYNNGHTSSKADMIPSKYDQSKTVMNNDFHSRSPRQSNGIVDAPSFNLNKPYTPYMISPPSLYPYSSHFENEGYNFYNGSNFKKPAIYLPPEERSHPSKLAKMSPRTEGLAASRPRDMSRSIVSSEVPSKAYGYLERAGASRGGAFNDAGMPYGASDARRIGINRQPSVHLPPANQALPSGFSNNIMSHRPDEMRNAVPVPENPSKKLKSGASKKAFGFLKKAAGPLAKGAMEEMDVPFGGEALNMAQNVIGDGMNFPSGAEGLQSGLSNLSRRGPGLPSSVAEAAAQKAKSGWAKKAFGFFKKAAGPLASEAIEEMDVPMGSEALDLANDMMQEMGGPPDMNVSSGAQQAFQSGRNLSHRADAIRSNAPGGELPEKRKSGFGKKAFGFLKKAAGPLASEAMEEMDVPFGSEAVDLARDIMDEGNMDFSSAGERFAQAGLSRMSRRAAGGLPSPPSGIPDRASEKRKSGLASKALGLFKKHAAPIASEAFEEFDVPLGSEAVDLAMDVMDVAGWGGENDNAYQQAQPPAKKKSSFMSKGFRLAKLAKKAHDFAGDAGLEMPDVELPDMEFE